MTTPTPETPAPCIGCAGEPGQHKRNCEWEAWLSSVIIEAPATSATFAPETPAGGLTAVCAEAFDEWLHRMHGITSSCRHEAEGEGIAAAVRAHLLSDAVVERAALAVYGVEDASETWATDNIREALAAAVGGDTQ